MTKNRLILFATSLAFFVVIASAAFVFGVKEVPTEGATIAEYDLLRPFFLAGHLNQYAYTSPYYRLVIFAYWYLVSFVLAFILLKVISKVRKS